MSITCLLKRLHLRTCSLESVTFTGLENSVSSFRLEVACLDEGDDWESDEEKKDRKVGNIRVVAYDVSRDLQLCFA